MQRITEENEPGYAIDAASRDLRGNAPAHRLAADRKPALSDTATYDVRNHGAIAGLELRVRIGKAAALLGVEEIEGDRVDPARRKRVRELDHEAARLPGAGAVT